MSSLKALVLKVWCPAGTLVWLLDPDGLSSHGLTGKGAVKSGTCMEEVGPRGILYRLHCPLFFLVCSVPGCCYVNSLAPPYPSVTLCLTLPHHRLYNKGINKHESSETMSQNLSFSL